MWCRQVLPVLDQCEADLQKQMEECRGHLHACLAVDRAVERQEMGHVGLLFQAWLLLSESGRNNA